MSTEREAQRYDAWKEGALEGIGPYADEPEEEEADEEDFVDYPADPDVDDYDDEDPDDGIITDFVNDPYGRRG